MKQRQSNYDYSQSLETSINRKNVGIQWYLNSENWEIKGDDDEDLSKFTIVVLYDRINLWEKVF